MSTPNAFKSWVIKTLTNIVNNLSQKVELVDTSDTKDGIIFNFNKYAKFVVGKKYVIQQVRCGDIDAEAEGVAISPRSIKLDDTLSANYRFCIHVPFVIQGPFERLTPIDKDRNNCIRGGWAWFEETKTCDKTITWD